MSSADLAVFKCICAAGLGLSSLGGVLAPVHYARRGRSTASPTTSRSSSNKVAVILSVANAGSAGLLLGAGLLHFLGESISGGVGYYSAAAHASPVVKASTDDPHHHGDEVEEALYHGVALALLLLIAGMLLPLLVDRVLLSALRGGAIPHGHSHDLHLGDAGHPSPGTTAVVNVPDGSDQSESGSQSGNLTGTNPPARSGQSKVLLIAILLAIHSFMEGATLGLERTSLALRSAIVPMLLHKFFDGLILGVSVAKKEEAAPSAAKGSGLVDVWRSIPKSALVWTLVTPLVMVATAITSGSSGSAATTVGHTAPSLTAIVVQGLGAGSFLYIALVEIVPEEFGPSAPIPAVPVGIKSREGRLGGNGTRWVALVLGCALVVFLESGHHHH